MPDKFPGMTIPELAGKIQRAFERISRDDRAKTERMPWSEHLEDWYLRAPASEAYDMRPKKEVKKPEPPKLDPELVERHKLPWGREKVLEPGYPCDLPIQQPQKPTANAENSLGRQDDVYVTEKMTQGKSWGRLCAAADIGRMDQDWSKHALAFQRDVGRKTKDPRAATEIMPWSGYLPNDHARPAMASKLTAPADISTTTTTKEEPKTQSHQRGPAFVPVDTSARRQPPLHNHSVPAQPVTRVDQDGKYQEAKATAIHMWSQQMKKCPDKDTVPCAHRFQGVY